LTRGIVTKTIEEGFNNFVIKNPSGCWGWAGCAPKNPGYGQFRYNAKRIRAHRASWIIHNGDIPNGMCVLHKCDNPICSNPDHLFLGTPGDNMRDAVQKGRNKYFGAAGEKNHKAKLKEGDIKVIRQLISGGVRQNKIAKLFNLHAVTVSEIKLGKTWKEVL
jgi:hypothetical protein